MIATALLALTLWHGCVHAPAKHGFLPTSDGVRIAYAELGSGPRGVVLAHLLVIPGRAHGVDTLPSSQLRTAIFGFFKHHL
jgi:hypothetical protein